MARRARTRTVAAAAETGLRVAIYVRRSTDEEHQPLATSTVVVYETTTGQIRCDLMRRLPRCGVGSFPFRVHLR
jgi:hypothetical protein